MSNNDNSSFMNGLILGALVGVSAGLLLAPQKGEETMADLKQRVGDVIEEGRRKAEEVKAEVQADVAEKVGDMGEAVSNQAEKIADSQPAEVAVPQEETATESTENIS